MKIRKDSFRDIMRNVGSLTKEMFDSPNPHSQTTEKKNKGEFKFEVTKLDDDLK